MMDRIYEKFLRTGVDTASLGMERREDNAPYFCTPKGATIIGWAGVDGIHFCFIRGFGQMVFSVSPMNAAPNYVHPLAKDFGDFLRLLLACGHVSALEQSWTWDESQFAVFLQENPPTPEQRQTLSEISEKLGLSPMEQPWAYINALQSAFDYTRIKYTEDCYDVDMNPGLTPPAWKVYFDGSFWGHRGRDRAGTEIPLHRQFNWAGYHWVIPSAYACSKGLVMDFCMQVDPERIRSFMKKWNLSWETDSRMQFTREQQTEMDWDNPLSLSFTPCLTLNGKSLHASHGCAATFNPCLPEGIVQELEAKQVLEHYGLDSAWGWVIYRNAFPWECKRRPEIKSLTLTMEQPPERFPGPHFKVHTPGDSFPFLHPVTGETHTLTVQEVERQTLPQGNFGSPLWRYPTHYTVMTYTLSPEPVDDLTLSDCDEGDRPVKITPEENPLRPVAPKDCGVIGGADGPTALIFGSESQGKLHTACSSLHFQPVPGDVEWRIIFYIKQFDAESFQLI